MSDWFPTEAQEPFLASTALEACFGGASGGGNTEMLVVDPLRFIEHASFRAILFVSSLDELRRNLLERTTKFYQGMGATLRDRVWHFPSGARLELAVMDHGTDLSRFNAEYHWIGFDDLTQFTESQYLFALTCLRATTFIKPRIRSSAQPVGPGRVWVLERFSSWLEGDADFGEVIDDRTLVGASRFENPYIDPQYAERVMLTDPTNGEAKLDGDWSARTEVEEDPIPGTVLEFIPWANPGWIPPKHLSSLAADLEAATRGEVVERYYTIPPRHAKSETIMNGLAWALKKNPKLRILYATHTATFAYHQSKRIKKLAKQAGVVIARGSNRIDEWETVEGGGVVARGVGGEITGRGFDIIIIDDPFKSRALAEVPTYRERVWLWMRDDVFTRGSPNASYIVVHTRWMPDDPIGRLIKEGWDGVVLRAFAEEDDPLGRSPGEALAPELGWTREVLEDRKAKVGEYGWASLFQCRPRPRGGKVFHAPAFYRALPDARIRRSYGVDLAYTAKTTADHSVNTEMLRHDPNPTSRYDRPKPVFYIRHVLSEQVEAPHFSKKLKAAQAKAPAPMLFLCAGTEKGAAQFIKNEVPRFRIETVSADKFVRAQDLAADWNDGRVLVPDPEVFPEVQEWLPEFLDVFENFTGVKDTRDDEVDSAVAAHKVLNPKRSGVGPISGYL